PGVLSSRLYLKRANRLAENRLFSVSERLFSLLYAQGFFPEYPHVFLDHALRTLLKNHPHDSICGCSVDAVHDEMINRYRGLGGVLDELDRRAADVLADMPPAAGAEKEAPAKKKKQAAARRSLKYWTALDPHFEPDRLVVYNLSGEWQCAPVRMTWASLEDSKAGQKGAGKGAGKEAGKEAGKGKSAAGGRSDVQIVGRQKWTNENFSLAGKVPVFRDVELIDGWIWVESLSGMGAWEVDVEPILSDRVGLPETARKGG